VDEQDVILVRRKPRGVEEEEEDEEERYPQPLLIEPLKKPCQENS